MSCNSPGTGKAPVDFAGQGNIRLSLCKLRNIGRIPRGSLITGIKLDSSLKGIKGYMDFPYRLAAVDLDGTLLGPNKKISDENAAAVSRLNEHGAKVIIASGRRHQNSVRFQRELGLNGPIIACQGGLIRDGESGNVTEAHFLPQTVAREITKEGDSAGVRVIYYHLDHLYVAERNDEWIKLYELRVGEKTETLPALDQLDGRRALKIVWYGDPLLLAKARPQMAEKYREKVDLLSTEKENLEFMPRGINKATALAKVASELGVPAKEVLAFGDGENDTQMLWWAGGGVAMRHGNPDAMAAARFVSPEGPPETAFAAAVDALLENHFERLQK
jgi:Cof subfamily protein (haloacid dehalogenase superfamily)